MFVSSLPDQMIATLLVYILSLASLSLYVASLEHRKSFLLQDGASSVRSVAVYEDSILITSSNDIIQKDIQTGIVQRTFRAHKSKVVSFFVTNHTKMITSGYDDMIIVWDLKTGSILKRIWLGSVGAQIETITVDNDRAFVGGGDTKVRELDLNSGRIVKILGYVHLETVF